MLNQFLFSEFMYEDVSWSGKKSLPTNTAKKNSQVVTDTQLVRFYKMLPRKPSSGTSPSFNLQLLLESSFSSIATCPPPPKKPALSRGQGSSVSSSHAAISPPQRSTSPLIRDSVAGDTYQVLPQKSPIISGSVAGSTYPVLPNNSPVNSCSVAGATYQVLPNNSPVNNGSVAGATHPAYAIHPVPPKNRTHVRGRVAMPAQQPPAIQQQATTGYEDFEMSNQSTYVSQIDSNNSQATELPSTSSFQNNPSGHIQQSNQANVTAVLQNLISLLMPQPSPFSQNGGIFNQQRSTSTPLASGQYTSQPLQTFNPPQAISASINKSLQERMAQVRSGGNFNLSFLLINLTLIFWFFHRCCVEQENGFFQSAWSASVQDCLLSPAKGENANSKTRISPNAAGWRSRL